MPPNKILPNKTDCYPALHLAAPSYVKPGNIAQNAIFLQGKIDECCLCFFEAQACLAYADSDLPPTLSSLPLSWHIHLPLDLPWDNVPYAAAISLKLCAKAAFLHPRLAVLHPPALPSPHQALIQFAAIWREAGGIPLLLENVATCDVLELGANFCADHNFGLCLDIAHAMAYGQEKLLSSDLPFKAVLAHWSAPGTGDRHLPLSSLSASQMALLRNLAPRLSPQATHLLEIFNWQGIMDSLPILARLLSP